MQVVEKEVTTALAQGLHARPAARFVETAIQFQSDITVTVGSRSASAKGLLGILGLMVKKGTPVRLRAEGSDAEEAIDALSRLLTGQAL